MSQKWVRHTDTHTNTQLLRPYKSDDCRFSYQHIPRFVYVFAYFVYNPTVSRLMLLLTAFPNVNDQAITPSERLVALSLRVYLALSGCVWGLVGVQLFSIYGPWVSPFFCLHSSISLHYRGGGFHVGEMKWPYWHLGSWWWCFLLMSFFFVFL